MPDQPDADGRILKPNIISWAFKDYICDSDCQTNHAHPEAVEAFKDMKYGINTRFIARRTWNFIGEDAGRIIDCDLPYRIMESPLKRDVTSELIKACRKQGLKIGLFYSHPDWFDADIRYDPNGPFFDKSFTPDDDPDNCTFVAIL